MTPHPDADTPAVTPLPRCPVGLIGLGIMGSEYARHLLAAGYEVFGFDVSGRRCADLESAGGIRCASASEVVERASVVITALSAIEAFRNVVLGHAGIGDSVKAGQVFVETGTLPLALKEEARHYLAQRGAAMIDAPITGTRMHAESRDLVVYASGESAVVEQVRPVLDAFAKEVRFVGDFGVGMKLKIVTNHLVAIHNIATAEALSLAQRAGLDLQMVYDLISAGPARSAVFGFRGPMMIADRYEPATMRLDVFDKDIKIIGDFIRQVDAATPLFDASATIYQTALENGDRSEDVSATFRVFTKSAPSALPGISLESSQQTNA